MAFSRFSVVIYVPITLYIFILVCEKLPTPYMDEEFHYPQAIKYFHGKYLEWNPKITTPPGLYALSNGLLIPLHKFASLNVENLMSFRAVNILFTIGNFFVIVQILKKIHHKDAHEDLFLVSALNITLLPTLYFFTFLYYTDCGSTFFILLMYLGHLHHRQWIASGFGMIAVFFRQTNIIWVFFVAAHLVYQMLLSKSQKVPSAPKVRVSSTKSRSSNFFRKQRTKLLFHLQYWLPVLCDVIYINLGYLVIGICFVFFLFVNKSIVLGDKAAHEPGFNVPQLFYYLLYTLFFASPFLISVPNIKAYVRMIAKYTFATILVAAGLALSIRYLTYEHPYLLSDNRHFTFYIWRRILNRNIYLTHLLIPVGIYSGWSMLYHLKHKDTFWKLLFVFCILLSIIPQRLFELRYFAIPFIIFRLQIKVRSMMQVYIEFAIFALVNAVTLYLFLEVPFHDGESVQRFMW